MKIAVIGCGWVGQKLAKFLSERGHHVIATTTTPEKLPALKEVAAEVHVLDFGKDFDSTFLYQADVAIFSMPVSSASWHTGFKNLKAEFPKTLFFSSTGIYPQDHRIYTENDTDHLRADLQESENLVRRKYPQTNVLRFGGLMGGDRSLQHFYTGRTPANTEKKVNYIHYEDILAIVELFLSSDQTAETYNLAAPEHPSIGEILNGNAPLSETPQRIISSEKLIQNFNYKFIHPNPIYFSR